MGVSAPCQPEVVFCHVPPYTTWSHLGGNRPSGSTENGRHKGLIHSWHTIRAVQPWACVAYAPNVARLFELKMFMVGRFSCMGDSPPRPAALAAPLPLPTDRDRSTPKAAGVACW